MATDPRRTLGDLGEQVAADHLARRGYRIVERNFRTRYGELDLVAASRRSLVFCEVKTRIATRPAFPSSALAAIGHDKRRRLRMLAAQWLATRPRSERPARPELRFDAIAVLLDPHGALLALEHVEDAF
jgi:putative endonuclease